MALDKEYFDAIHIDVVKKKYYNANKVEAVFADIRAQAAELLAENAQLKAQLEACSDRRLDRDETVLAAQDFYRRVVERANDKAEAILAEARRESREIRADAVQRQDNAVQQMERCVSRIRELHQSAIEEVNGVWQEFLCGLYPEDAEEEDEIAPGDLREKVDAIAREMLSIGGED